MNSGNRARLYELLRDEPVLPHSRRLGNVAFVSPAGAADLLTPTAALEAQRAVLLECYARSSEQVVLQRRLVDLPKHVIDACVKHSGLTQLEISFFIEKMLCDSSDAMTTRLAPCVLALAEIADGSEVWRTRLAGRPIICLLYTSPSPRDAHESRMPSSA